jgi:protein-disulfide isomerase
MSKKNRATDRASRAAAAMAVQQQQERRRRNLMVGGVVVGVVVVVLIGWLISRSLDSSNDVDAPTSGSEFGVTIGPDDAPNKVVVYEDFLCPFCGELERQTREDLAQLAEEGKVQVEYRPFNLLSSISDYSERSAGAFSIVLKESGSDVAKKFHDLLFENQPAEGSAGISDARLLQYAVQAGADRSTVSTAIQDRSFEQWVKNGTDQASKDGVTSTPTVKVNGRTLKFQTIDELVAKVNKAVAAG